MWGVGKTQYFYSARNCKYEVARSEICVSGLYHLFSVSLILLTNAYAGCGRPTLNVVERFWFWLGSVRSASNIDSNELTSELHSYAQLYSNVLRSWELEAWQPEVRTWQKLENLIAISPRVTKSSNIVCTHYVKVFCILCLCIILSDTSKASENLTFILKQSLILSSFCTCVSIIICCLAAMKIEGSIGKMISNLFQNCDVSFEGVNVNCDPGHVLNGNRRSRYEQFHFIHSNCARKYRSCRRARSAAQSSTWKNLSVCLRRAASLGD